MKTALKRILSFVCILCIAFIGVFVMPTVTASAAEYVPTKFGEGKMLITTKFNGSTYYLPATTTSSSPKAVAFTNVSTIGEEHLWTVTANGSNYYIQNNDGAYLYGGSDTKTIKVGATQQAWTYNSTENSFKNATTSRYLGVYNATDWRHYTNHHANYKGSSTSFVFYKVNAAAPSVNVEGDDYTQVGKSINLTATVANTTGTVAWTSSNTSVATVANGVVEAKAMGKTTIYATVNGTEGEKDVVVYPVAGSELSIADALTVCELTGTTNAPYTYSTTGTIASIDTAYSEQYGNITVTITDGTDSIKAFRMKGGEELTEGDNITVTGTLVNYSGNTPEFVQDCTYVRHGDAATDAIREKLNNVNAYMQLAYSYNVTKEMQAVSGEKVDTLNRALTDVSGTNYKEWSGKTATSSAVYAGQSAGGKESIQLRSNNSNSGIVTTTSGGKAKKIIVEWNSDTAAGRTLDIYGKNTAYSLATDLYDNETKGDHLGSIAFGSSTELEITGDYAYIGLRSKSGAMYLSEIQIVWETEGDIVGEKEVEVLSDSEFFIKCAVDASLLEIEGADSFGIRVTANGKTKEYTSINASSWTVKGGMAYVVIYLDDIVNDTAKMMTEFTVEAYVVIDGTTYTSTASKTHSVASMIKEYYETLKITEVEHLYNYLFN